jgi:retron-type reverse transcriptase
MVFDIENVVENIDFSMKMEDMPLTEDDKNRLRNCLSGKSDIQKIIEETIQKHTIISLA